MWGGLGICRVETSESVCNEGGSAKIKSCHSQGLCLYADFSSNGTFALRASWKLPLEITLQMSLRCLSQSGRRKRSLG